MYLIYVLRVKDQGRTKEEPRNDQRNPNHQKVLFIKIAVSFTSLIPCLVLPRELRENTERTLREDLMTKKTLFLRLSPKKVVLIPEKVISLPKKVDSFPETVDLYSSPLHLTLYTLHQKNRTKMRFFLHIRKFCSTFALVNLRWGCLHISGGG